MSEAFDGRARKTGETFYCPAGHRLVYNGGKSTNELLITRLRQDLKRTQDTINILNREVLTCQWVGCGFGAKDLAGLWTHMRAIHEMPTLAEVQVAS